MFYALAHKKIDMRGFEVEHVIEDIESLNQRALSTKQDGGWRMEDGEKLKTKASSVIRHPLSSSLEVTAVSCHAYAYLADKYAVMRSGASVGDNYGPILVTKKQDIGCRMSDDVKTSFMHKKIAVPGKLTTANLVLQLFAKNQTRHPSSVIHHPVFMKFDQIIDAVENGEADYGLIIHEGQITYDKHGLEKVLDLGEWWHEKTKLPLPLGSM